MTDMYEAGELLEEIQQIVEFDSEKEVEKLPNGDDPVYWPRTVYGKSGMMSNTAYDHLKDNKTLPFTGKTSS